MTAPIQDQRTRTSREELTALIAAGAAQLTTAWSILHTSQRTLLARLAQIQGGRTVGATQQIRTALVAFNADVGEFDRRARAFVERWAAQDLPIAYRDGAVRALERAEANRSLFTWTANHQAAITGLTAPFWGDLIRRITEAVRRAQAFARAAQDAARSILGVQTERLLEEHPLDTVIYSNQARHPVHAWAAAALSWQGVVTANSGAINTARDELNAEWMQVRDGPECVMPGGRFLPHGHLKQMVRAWFSGPAYRIVTRTPVGTNLLTVGPNHPVLTERGWVRAHLLREGDQLVYDRLGEDAATRSELHLEQVPMVEDVYASLVKAFPLSVRSASRHDLHRDGEFCKGEVDVVTVARSLLIESDATSDQHGGESHLVRPYSGTPSVVGTCSSSLTVGSNGNATYSGMGCRGTFFPGVGPGVGMPQAKSHATGSGDSGSLYDPVHLADGEPKEFGDLRRLASVFDVEAAHILTRKASASRMGALIAAEPPLALVMGMEGSSADLASSNHLVGSVVDLSQRFSLSRVESISAQSYEGWVYDASTSGGTFTIDGLIVANCGWVNHPDTDHADGTLRSLDECATYPSAHHGCIREFYPRPDLTGRTDIADGDPA